MAGRDAAAILAELEPLGVRLELDWFRALLAALGPPPMARATVLVAGTNGKGSVAALIESVVRRAGRRTGLYTSPHLESWNERVRVCGDAIGDAALASRLETVVGAARSSGLGLPTPFEALTAAALLEFAEREVDVAVLEVGLGGRLDATNAIEPTLAVITRIALDHRAELGEDLATIAREKAGILRPGVPLVLTPQPAEARRAILERATCAGAPVVDVERSVSVDDVEWRGLDGMTVGVRTPRLAYRLRTALAGAHQVDNLRTAVAAGETLADAGVPIRSGEIEEGVERCRWPGRLERLRHSGSGAEVLLDAAHNPDGCRALRAFLDRLGRAHGLVFGCLADKDAAAMLDAVAPGAEEIVLTRPTSTRAAAPRTLLALLEDRGATARVIEEPSRAVASIAGRDRLTVVAGSIVLVGEVRRALREAGYSPGG